MKKRTALSDVDILSAIIGLLVLTMVAGTPVTLQEGFQFYLYMLFSILIPGLAVHRLLHIPAMDTLEESVCGYGLGYVLMILQYFLLAACGQLNLLLSIQPVISGSAVFFLFRSAQKEQNPIRKSNIREDWLPLVCLIFLVSGIRYVSYYGLNLLPSPEQDVTFQTQDILFYIGNAISAKNGFPIEEFRFSGQTFKYHYFGSLYLGTASLLTGIDALKLELCLQWMQATVLATSSFYVLMRRMEIRRRLCLLGMVLLLFTAGAESLVYVTYQYHMYKTPFGYDLGLAMGIFFVLYLYLQNTLPKFHRGVFAAMLLSFFACEGTKAPVAAVLLFFAGTVCFLWLISAGKRTWAFSYGASLMAVFLAVFFGFVSDGMRTVTANASGLHIDPTGHLYACGLGKLYFKWTALGVPEWMGKLAVLLLYFIGCNMAVYCLLPVFVLKSIFSQKRWLFSFEGCILSTVAFGLALTLLTKQTGNSQMYFAMTSFPLATILCMKVWSQGEGIRNDRIRGKLFYGIFSLLFLAGMVCFAQALGTYLLSGGRKLAGKSDCRPESNSLTFAEAEAYRWVREETPEDSLCVTNLVLNDSQFESFVVGVCTERQMYMEGWRYVSGYLPQETVDERRRLIRDFFEGKEEAAEEILRTGADYIIWVKRYGDNKTEVPDRGSKVFENSAAAIYDLKTPSARR